MFEMASKISGSKKKNIIKILFDMLKCLIKYQASFKDYYNFEFYELSKEQRLSYVTSGKNKKIIDKFNDVTETHLLNNKIEFNEKFSKYLKRDYIEIKRVSLREFKEFVFDKDSMIVKPIIGSGYRIINLKDTVDNVLFDELVKEDVIIEEVIKQHDNLNKLCNKEINSLKIITFCKDQKVYILQIILTIGNMYAFVNSDGLVTTLGIDLDGKTYKVHPLTNEPILGFQVPFMKESIELVKEASLEIPKIGYIEWEVAVTNEGSVIIEGKEKPSLYQVKASLGNKIGLVSKCEEIMGIKF